MKKYYSSYKYSGVEWIGEIPSHWIVSKFKFISKLYTGNSLNDQQKRLYQSEDESHIPYVSSKDIDINYKKVNYNNGLRIPIENNPLKVGKKGSFLLCVEGGSSGKKMVFLEQDVCFVNKLCCFESSQETKYQYYYVQTSNFQYKFKMSLTGLIGGVSISTLRDFEIPLPPLTEQQKIVKYLDSKTEKIDTLIKCKKLKIELLKEKRTSLINDVVTKGLNPKVKMKDSGVEWIGEIPNHWKIIPLKFLGDFQNGISKGSEFFGKGLPFMNYGDVYKNEVTPENVTGMVDSDEVERERYSVRKGDVFFTRTSESKDDIGVTSTCLKTIENCVFSGFLIRFRFNGKTHNSEFSRYHFQSHWKKVLIESKMNIVTRSSLSQQVLGQVPVLVPPIDEQVEIVDYLNLHVTEIENLVKLEFTKIQLLQEYRQSIISELVTGKIRVCDEVDSLEVSTI